MKNKLQLLVLILLLNCQIQGQDTSYMHLVMFSSEDLFTQFYDPRSKEEINRTLTSILWRLEGNNLIMLDTLNFPDKGIVTIMEHCRHFDEDKWIYILEREFFPTYYLQEPTEVDSFLDEDTFISVLDYGGDSIVVRRLRGSDYSPFFDFARYSTAYFVNKKLYYKYSVDLNNKSMGSDYIINKFLLDGHQISKEVYEDSFYIKNESGQFCRFNRLYFIIKDNEIKKDVFERQKYNTLEDWPENDMDIPASDDEYKYYLEFEFLLRTPTSNYVIGRKQRHKPNPDTLELYYVYDKSMEKWDTIYMPNTVKNFNIYDDRYLYGTLWKQCKNCEYEQEVDSVLAFIKKYPKKYSWKYADYPNLLNNSGKMFIYDLERRRYYEYQVEDKDAELLQIIDGWIYYRVYDEVRRMRMGEQNPFDSSKIEVMVKNKEIVPNVHYIFFKKKSPIVEEWVTPSPSEKLKKIKNQKKKKNK